jgi:casein kinase II subunit beta
VLPVGLSDSLKVSRFKVFCPRCEEVYIPKFRSVNIDGGFFGTSFPHHFLKHYPQAVILPPKIYHYEPKIHGFKIVGKRGSKYFNPPTGNIRFNEDSMTGIDKEKQVEKIKAQNSRTNRFAQGGPAINEVQSLTQKMLNQNFFVTETKTSEEAISESLQSK